MQYIIFLFIMYQWIPYIYIYIKMKTTEGGGVTGCLINSIATKYVTQISLSLLFKNKLIKYDSNILHYNLLAAF